MSNTIRITGANVRTDSIANKVAALAKKIPVREAMTMTEVCKAIGTPVYSGHPYAIVRNSGCAIYLILNGRRNLCLCHPKTAKRYATNHPAGSSSR